MPIQRSEISCGVYQFWGLRSPSHALLKHVMRNYQRVAGINGRSSGFAQIIFSDVTLIPRAYFTPKNGERFANYLLKQFPNSNLVKLEAKRSPSTGNNICTYIWNIPHVAFKKHKYYPKTRTRR